MHRLSEILQSNRLGFSLFASCVLHALIIGLVVFLLLEKETMRFKSGTGQYPSKIKISKFLEHISQTDAAQTSQNPAANTQDSYPFTQSLQSQESLQQQSVPSSQDYDGDLQNTQEDSSDKATDPNPLQEFNQNTQTRTPLSQIFSQYNPDSITKRDIMELYGEEFGDYGLVEREFLINNLRDIGRITARYLKYPKDAIRLGQQGVNIVQFYLHPNGDISELSVIKPSGYIILDRNSVRTIEIAYKDYPHPKSKVLIRIRVSMELYYY